MLEEYQSLLKNPVETKDIIRLKKSVPRELTALERQFDPEIIKIIQAEYIKSLKIIEIVREEKITQALEQYQRAELEKDLMRFMQKYREKEDEERTLQADQINQMIRNRELDALLAMIKNDQELAKLLYQILVAQENINALKRARESLISYQATLQSEFNNQTNDLILSIPAMHSLSEEQQNELHQSVLNGLNEVNQKEDERDELIEHAHDNPDEVENVNANNHDSIQHLVQPPAKVLHLNRQFGDKYNDEQYKKKASNMFVSKILNALNRNNVHISPQDHEKIEQNGQKFGKNALEHRKANKAIKKQVKKIGEGIERQEENKNELAQKYNTKSNNLKQSENVDDDFISNLLSKPTDSEPPPKISDRNKP